MKMSSFPDVDNESEEEKEDVNDTESLISIRHIV